jgi:hypothetical protein
MPKVHFSNNAYTGLTTVYNMKHEPSKGINKRGSTDQIWNKGYSMISHDAFRKKKSIVHENKLKATKHIRTQHVEPWHHPVALFS